MVPGSGGHGQSLHNEVLDSWREMIEVVITLDFEVLVVKFEVSKIRDLKTIPT